MMTKIYELLDENNGYVTYHQIKEHGISYNTVKKMLNEKIIEKEGSGIYKYPDIYIDELFTVQYHYPKGIYTLETALWIHGLSLHVPSKMIMCFPYGTNTKQITSSLVKPIVSRNHYEEGIVQAKTPGGQLVNVYEKERALIECLRPVYKIDIQIIIPAFKTYICNKDINIDRLFMYARLFKVEDKVHSYLEVLM